MVSEQVEKLLDKLIVNILQANAFQIEYDRDTVYVVLGTQFVDFFEHVGQKPVQAFHFSFVGVVVLDLDVEHRPRSEINESSQVSVMWIRSF